MDNWDLINKFYKHFESENYQNHQGQTQQSATSIHLPNQQQPLTQQIQQPQSQQNLLSQAQPKN